MRSKRTFEVRGQAASLHGGRTSSVRARGRGRGAQPSRRVDRLIERIFLNRLNEVAEDVVRSIRMRRKRLSYVDDIPLRQRFPSTKLPASKQQSSVKPLTITLPAPSSRTPLRSVTNILRELKNPSVPNDSALDHLNPSTVSPSLEPLRFGGAEVAYTASALQKEAAEFAQALASTNIPSQPSPPQWSLSGAPEPLATATPPHAPTNQND